MAGQIYRLPSAAGGAPFRESTIKIIRLLRFGCANRPFFHISVTENNTSKYEPVIEQIGCYDPVPNMHNEKLVAFNFKRLEHWMKQGAVLTLPVQKLLGLGGYFPVHHKTYQEAWERRKKVMETLKELQEQKMAKAQGS